MVLSVQLDAAADTRWCALGLCLSRILLGGAKFEATEIYGEGKLKLSKKRKKEAKALDRGTHFFQGEFLPEVLRKLQFIVCNASHLAPNILGSFPVELKAPPNYNNLNLEGNDPNENLSYEEFPEMMHNFLMTNRHHPYEARQDNAMENRVGVSGSLFSNSPIRPKKIPGLPPAEIFGRSIWASGGQLIAGINLGVESVPHISFSDAEWYEPFDFDEDPPSNLAPGLFLMWLGWKATGPDTYNTFNDYLEAVVFTGRNEKLQVAQQYMSWFSHTTAEGVPVGDHPSLGAIIKRLRKERLQKACVIDSDFSPAGAEFFQACRNGESRSKSGSIPTNVLEHIALQLKDEVDMVKEVISRVINKHAESYKRFVFDSKRVGVVRKICQEICADMGSTLPSNNSEWWLRLRKGIAYHFLVREFGLSKALEPPSSPYNKKVYDEVILSVANELAVWDTPEGWNIFKVVFNDPYTANTANREARYTTYHVTDRGNIRSKKLIAGASSRPIKLFVRNLAFHMRNSDGEDDGGVFLLGDRHYYDQGMKNAGTSSDYRKDLGGVAHVLVDKNARTAAEAFKLYVPTQALRDKLTAAWAMKVKEMTQTAEHCDLVTPYSDKNHDPFFLDLRAATRRNLEGFQSGFIPPHFYELGGLGWSYLGDCRA
eukprot:Gregarina_sp_Poly_1__10576@NODE_786_length_6292_cov_38_531406_g575_i0_p2_GENE_NODE_786_length_6292_cov_38_531406_g575_i0NODE_786_length_6292_cov_38_531406_g575_i0_p2_ORF_typecomplete_len655_score90_50_NODE_786_length_6292_cov_38_531406_g575_i033985362